MDEDGFTEATTLEAQNEELNGNLPQGDERLRERCVEMALQSLGPSSAVNHVIAEAKRLYAYIKGEKSE